MPLVELIRGSATDDATEAAIRALAAELGKQVIVSADRPGFIVNRILMPLLAEAMRACEEGLGTAEDIDTGAKVGLNHPMGPLELADFIGLDVCLGVMRVLHEGLGAAAVRAAAGAGGAGRRRATWARRRAAGSTPTRAEDGRVRAANHDRGRRRPARTARCTFGAWSSSPGPTATSTSSRGAHADRQVRRGARVGVPAVELGATAIRAAVERSGLPRGRPDRRGDHGPGAAGGRRPGARRARRCCGRASPDTTPATTINRVCGSGLKAIMFAAAGDPGR